MYSDVDSLSVADAASREVAAAAIRALDELLIKAHGSIEALSVDDSTVDVNS